MFNPSPIDQSNIVLSFLPRRSENGEFDTWSVEHVEDKKYQIKASYMENDDASMVSLRTGFFAHCEITADVELTKFGSKIEVANVSLSINTFERWTQDEDEEFYEAITDLKYEIVSAIGNPIWDDEYDN